MEPKQVKTSEGHIVYIKQELTRAESKAVSRITKSIIKFDPISRQPVPISVTEMQDASRQVLDVLVVKVILPNGEQAADNKFAVDDMKEEDEAMLIKEANAVTNKQKQISKKNETTI